MASPGGGSSVESAVSAFLAQDAEKSRATLAKILGNLVKDPTNEKYRKLRLSNAVVKAKIVDVPFALGVLEAVGFVAEGDEMALSGTVDVDLVRNAIDALQPQQLTLSMTLAHAACVRGVAVSGSLVGTAALDNVFRLFDTKGALIREGRAHTKPARSDPGVLAVALVEDGRAFTAGRDGAMVAWAADGESCTRFVGHGDEIPGEPHLTNAQTVSCVCASRGLVLTGGWDRTCVAWDTVDSNPARRYGPFGAAVNGIAMMSATVAVAACGDGSIAFFDPTVEAPDPVGTLKETYVLAIHNDAKGPPMRAVATWREEYAVTVSNDGVARLWAKERGLIRGAKASSEYLFAVACDDLRAYIGGDDGVVTIVSLPSMALHSRVAQPGPVWSLAFSDGALAVGCEAPFGALVWTRDPKRAAPAVVAENVRNLCGEALANIARAGDTLEVLEGDMARPTAASGGAGGDVSLGNSQGGGGGPPASSGYDFSFPVDLGRGQDLRIEWNRGDDPNLVAVNFCNQYGIPMNQTGDIVSFINSAGGGVTAAASEPSPEKQAEMISQIVAMGVEEERARDACAKASWTSVEDALRFLF